MALAWVAVLASALAAHDRVWGTDADDDPRAHDEARDHSWQTRYVAGRPPQSPADGSPQLLEFARELHATLESDRLRLLISRRLPALLGLHDVWIVARFGNRQQIIVPSRPGTEGAPFLSDEARQWSTYPMKADGQTIGLLGIALPAGGFRDRDHRLFTLVASLVASLGFNKRVRGSDAMIPRRAADGLLDAPKARASSAELRRHRSGTSLAVLMLDLDHQEHQICSDTRLATRLSRRRHAADDSARERRAGGEVSARAARFGRRAGAGAADKLRRRIASTPVGAIA